MAQVGVVSRKGGIAGAYTTHHQSTVRRNDRGDSTGSGLVVATRNVDDFEMFPVKTFHSLHGVSMKAPRLQDSAVAVDPTRFVNLS